MVALVVFSQKYLEKVSDMRYKGLFSGLLIGLLMAGLFSGNESVAQSRHGGDWITDDATGMKSRLLLRSTEFRSGLYEVVSDLGVVIYVYSDPGNPAAFRVEPILVPGLVGR